MLRYGMMAGRWALGKFTGAFASRADDAAKAATSAGSGQIGAAVNRLDNLRASGNLSREALATELQGVVGASAEGARSQLTRASSRIGSAIKIGGLAAVGEFAINGREGIIGGAANRAWTELGKIEVEQNTNGRWHQFYKNIQEFLKMVGIEGTVINQWVDDRIANSARTTRSTFDRIVEAPLTQDIAQAGQTAAIGTAAIGAGLVAGNAIRGAFRGGGDGASGPGTPGGPTATISGAAAEVADDAAKPGFLSNVWRKISGSRMGRIAAIGVAGAGVLALSGDEARAESPVTADRNAPAPEQGILERGVNFARGMAAEAADVNNYSVRGAVNLGHAAADGAVRGVAGLGAFAYANTVGWFTGATTESATAAVNRGIDVVQDATVGAPDLSGHWAQAVSNVASVATPGLGIAGAATRTARAFQAAGAGARTVSTVRIGTELGLGMAAPVGP